MGTSAGETLKTRFLGKYLRYLADSGCRAVIAQGGRMGDGMKSWLHLMKRFSVVPIRNAANDCYSSAPTC